MNYFKRRKLIKKQIQQEVYDLEQERQDLLDKTAESERKALKKSFKKQDKLRFSELKEDAKHLKGSEKRWLKRKNKWTKKFLNRRKRRLRHGVLVVVLAMLVVQFGPNAAGLYRTLTGAHINIDTSSKEAQLAREHGEKVSELVAEEGIVLLRNEEEYLPIDSDTKLNVFGVSAHHIRYGGGGSGASDTSRAIDLFTALEGEGIQYNQNLFEFYEELSDKLVREAEGSGLLDVVQGFLGTNVIDEDKIDHLTDDVIKEAKDFSDHALVVISSSGTEASDFTEDQLFISENKLDLLKKVRENFKHVTVIVNAGNAISLEFLESLDVDAALWVGTPGPYGMRSLAKTMKGDLNPSGRLVDTYAYDPTTSAASVNFGDYQYDNLDKAWIAYEEGIYVGYRFYETYYQDENEYQKVVQYPFGYGLSYTEFDWNLISHSLQDDKIKLSVEVKNIGKHPGKDVVQAYFSAPYIAGGLEKSKIELIDYGKTKVLKPNESQVLDFEIDIKDMASYDVEQAAYRLDKGQYDVFLSRNIHDSVIIESFNLDEKVYTHDLDTEVAYENHFSDAQGDFTYLSRADFEGTFPKEHERKTSAPDSLVEAMNQEPEIVEGDPLTFGKDHGIKLNDLKGLAFDDPKWDLFLEQWTLKEMMRFVTDGAYHTEANDRLGVPSSTLMDGPAGISYFFGDVVAAAYPTEVVIASTWNNDLAYAYGEAVGKEAIAYGLQGWYAPAMNIHRTSQGGRNFEYYSEDPILSGYMGASVTNGAQDQGIMVFIKHFVMNDQEENARSGIVVWAHEQAIREIYLKPFEITVKKANPLGAMSSFSFIGENWAGAHEGLLNHVLREEWGFEGFVSSDAVFGFMKAKDAIVSGNDLMLDVLNAHGNYKDLKKAYKKNPVHIGEGLKNSVHHVLYTLLQLENYGD